MTTRRVFLQGATLAAVPLVAGLPGTAATNSGTALTYQAVLIDDRYAESRSFGARLAARGAALRVLPQGDVTSLWLQEIGPAWRRAPVPVAGLTRPSVLFCLEQLAWAQGLRVVFHAEHVVAASRPVDHVVQSYAAGVGALAADDLSRHGLLWPMQVADAIADYGATASAHRPGPSSAALLPALPPDADLLTSWIIAPA